MKYLNIRLTPVMGAIATESIAFQKGDFFRDLTDVVKSLRKNIISKSAFCNMVNNCVFKHTGITVTTEVAHDFDNACITVERLTASNALSDEIGSKINQLSKHNTLREATNELRGSINSKTSRVSGFFSKIPFFMWICSSFVQDDQKLSPEAAAAIILHEIGHAFTFLQFSMDVMVNNIALTMASQKLAKTKSHQEVIMVYRDICEGVGMSDVGFIKEIKDSNNVVVHYEFIASKVNTYLQQLRNNDSSFGYSQNACEELADIFAARHGAAQAVMEVRGMFGKEQGWITMNVMQLFLKASAGVLTTTVSAALGNGLIFSLAAVYTISALMDLYGFIKHIGSMNGITTAHQQIRKMQNQLIERLKSGNVNKLVIDQVMDGMEYGDQLMATLAKDDGAFFKVYAFFSSRMSDARAMREYQDQLEGMVSNRLFLSAAKLSS